MIGNSATKCCRSLQFDRGGGEMLADAVRSAATRKYIRRNRTPVAAAGQFDEALQSLRKADQALAEAEKQNPGLSRNLTRRSEILNGEAQVHVAQKHWDRAIPALTGMISIFESQRKRDPKNELYLSSQPSIYTRLAECYAESGRWDQAVSAMHHAMDRLEEIQLQRPLVQDEEEQRKTTAAKLAEWARQGRGAPVR